MNEKTNLACSNDHTTGRLWYILYTYPRAEKKVYNHLLNNNIEAFLPTTKTISRWKNRQVRLIEKVLFPSYIFVKINKGNLSDMIKLSGISSFVSCGNEPSTMRQSEIDYIKTILNQNLEITTDSYVKNNNQYVKIMSGPFMGYEGIIVNKQGKSLFGIELKGIKQVIFVNIDINIVQTINSVI